MRAAGPVAARGVAAATVAAGACSLADGIRSGRSAGARSSGIVRVGRVTNYRLQRLDLLPQLGHLRGARPRKAQLRRARAPADQARSRS